MALRRSLRWIGSVTTAGSVAAYLRYKYEMVKSCVREQTMIGALRLCKADDEWRGLDRAYSGTIVELVQELRGMYTKYGQIGAGLTNTFSKIWIEKLRKLEDRVTPQPAEVVLETIEHDHAKPWSELFAEFDQEPLGSASIGQVAVKVQYPDSERLFRSDMATIRSFFEIFAPEQVIILGELERSFEHEFNYEMEAANLREVWGNIESGFRAEALVPQPVSGLTTRRVLVMEMLQGPKLKDGLTAYARTIAADRGITLEQFEQLEREKIELEGATPYDGPTATELERYLTATRWRDWGLNMAISGYNATVAAAGLTAPIELYDTTLPPNVPRLIDALMRIHGHQLLVNGLFNADPHAGNFLLLPDGKIGLIDYGSTKRLSRSDRIMACVIYAALARGDRGMIVDVARNGGYKSKYFNQDVIWKLMRFGFDSYNKDLMEGKNVQTFIDDLYATDPYTEGADNLIMVNFLSIRLRAVALQMGYWGELAERELEREGLPYKDWNLDLMKKIAPPEQLSIAKG